MCTIISKQSIAQFTYCVIAIVFLCSVSISICSAFAPSHIPTNIHDINLCSRRITSLYSTKPNNNQKTNQKKKKSNKSQYKTIADMMTAMEKNPNQFVTNGKARDVNANGKRIDKKKKPKRSRARVDRPKQKYVYASQRKSLEMNDGQSKQQRKNSDGLEGGDVIEEEDGQQPNNMKKQQQHQKQMEFIRSLGLNPTSQVADVTVGNSLEDIPRIMGSVRVDGVATTDDNDSEDEEDVSITSNSFAYVIYKPVGWSILGEKKKGKKNKSSQTSTSDTSKTATNNKQSSKSTRVKAYDEQTDEFTFVEYNEADVLAVLTPEERAELLKEGGLSLDDDMADIAKGNLAGVEWDDEENEDSVVDSNNKSKKKKKQKNEEDTPRSNERANLNSYTRPSLVSWLKDLKSSEGSPIKGGKNWVAIAGATEVDDSGLVLLCPKDRIDTVHVDKCGYIAIVGNGKKLTSRSKLFKSKSITGGGGEVLDYSTAQVEILSRIKRGRDSDPILSVAVDFPDGAASTCSHAVMLCQEKFGDGVRGDALADPLERRASRRLVHCDSMTVTSLVNLDGDPVMIEECDLPDDVTNYANRRDGAVFNRGSFLGRQSGLSQNGLTNAYREVNGAADGYPGWTVDRYDKWLFVQQEENPMSVPRGPLPSLHDGYTAGVYYLPTKVDRSVMGSEKIKPTLLEGQAAPEYIPVMENGITYLVNMGESFSTGIFLDQRLQRAWLSQQCNEDTRVLNCFAHAGAFSVAAATQGAKTVSLDLDKKWLDRIRPQMEANGINEWEDKHDCIYGDCFDWLARLAKRGEQFDIVILDPPSTSVGKKKKRWSVKSDMAELVSLAAPLVKNDGLLFTTTNSATLRADKFASMCKKGLSDAGVTGKLERVSPMPYDFVSIGPQPVKNLVWKISRD